MEKYNFSCGCSFDVIRKEGNLLRIKVNTDVEELPFECQRTWDLYARGDMKGVFQLEKQGRMAKKLAPNNLEELAALISIIRPGCAESIIDGKSVTNHYIDRKHKREEVTYYHPILELSLKRTYGLLVYQEQAMQIVKDIANFTLQEADNLRRAIGKKKPEEMAQVKTKFIEKAGEVGIVTAEEAEEIFSWIEKSQRYSFNASHAVAYAFNSYISAYFKAHMPKLFFTSYLYHSQANASQKDEIKELTNNARSLYIDVRTPDFRRLMTPSDVPNLIPSRHFMLRDQQIFVGLTDIKGIGEKQIDKLIANVERAQVTVGCNYTEFTDLDVLLFCLSGVNKTVVKALIEVGCFSYLSSSRNRMTYEYDIIQRLTDKEIAYIQDIYLNHTDKPDTLQKLFQILINSGTGRSAGIASEKRQGIVVDIFNTLCNPPRSLVDSADWISGIEQSLLGIALTCSKVDDRDTSAANCTCQDFRGVKQNYYVLAGEINNVSEIKTKRGKNPGQKMAFITMSDTSGSLDNIVAFPEAWDEFKGLLVSGNTVLIGGEKGKEDGSLIVKKVHQI